MLGAGGRRAHVVVRRGQQQRQHWVRCNVVDTEPVTVDTRLVRYVEQLAKFGVGRKGHVPEVQRSILMLGYH